MAKRDWLGEVECNVAIDSVYPIVNIELMTCGMNQAGKSGQFMVDQRPQYDNALRKRKGRRPNQVIGKSGIIRSDKRLKAKFL